MNARFLLPGVLAAALLAPLAASAAAGPVTSYPVPRGGFSLDLPTSWIDLTSTSSAPRANGKTPTMADIAQAASKDGTKKLLVLDPKGNGRVYMAVDVERIGAVGLAEAASATKAAILRAIGSKGTLTERRVAIPAGPAYLMHFVYKQPTGTYESNEYLVIHSQIEYLLLQVAPKAAWGSYSPAFDRAAQTFKLLPQPDLSQVVLSSRQIGSGYKSSVIQGGDSFIGETTLDLCAGTYPSESLRTGRLQMRYVRSSSAVAVSNEVVTYVAGGAQEALREVRSVAQACAQKPVVLRRGALKNTLSVTPIKDSKLLPGAVAVRIKVVESNGKKQSTSTGVAIYQVKNDTLSGVYAWTSPHTSLAQATQLGLRAAEQSARNLGGGSTGLTA